MFFELWITIIVVAVIFNLGAVYGIKPKIPILIAFNRFEKCL